MRICEIQVSAYFLINSYWMVTRTLKKLIYEEHICKFLELKNKYIVLKGMYKEYKN